MAWVAPSQHGEVYVKSCWMVWMVRQQAQARDTWSPWWPLRGKWQKHCNASRRRFEGQCSPERGLLSHNSTWDVPNTIGHQIVATRYLGSASKISKYSLTFRGTCGGSVWQQTPYVTGWSAGPGAEDCSTRSKYKHARWEFQLSISPYLRYG